MEEGEDGGKTVKKRPSELEKKTPVSCICFRVYVLLRFSARWPHVGRSCGLTLSAISVFVTQEKDATVIVVTGPDNGRVGTLYGIDGADGIVQLDDDIKILDLGHLAECEEG